MLEPVLKLVPLKIPLWLLQVNVRSGFIATWHSLHSLVLLAHYVQQMPPGCCANFTPLLLMPALVCVHVDTFVLFLSYAFVFLFRRPQQKGRSCRFELPAPSAARLLLMPSRGRTSPASGPGTPTDPTPHVWKTKPHRYCAFKSYFGKMIKFGMYLGILRKIIPSSLGCLFSQNKKSKISTADCRPMWIKGHNENCHHYLINLHSHAQSKKSRR